MSINSHTRSIWLAAATVIVVVAWFNFGSWQSPQPSRPPAITPPHQAARIAAPETPEPGASPQPESVPALTTTPATQRNMGITPRSLTTNRLATAAMFLRQVTLIADPRGGFIVQAVDKGSLYEQMGLRPGDRVFSIDTADNADIDDDSLDAGMQQTRVEMQVYRDGSFVTLGVEL